MYKIFRHGGKIGDVIFSLPTIRELGGGIIYLPERTPDGCSNLYSSLKDLLLQQPYIKEVREYPSDLPYMELAPGIHIDYDLDTARNQPLKGVIHIVKRYMDAFGVNYPGWKEPWLFVDDYNPFSGGDYTIINYTGRHIKNNQLNIESTVDWCKVQEGIKGDVFFIGSTEEYISFCDKFGYHSIWVDTPSTLHVARFVKFAKSVYCNQSSILSIAQGLGKTYYLEPKPMKRNCLLETPNENILQ